MDGWGRLGMEGDRWVGTGVDGIGEVTDNVMGGEIDVPFGNSFICG